MPQKSLVSALIVIYGKWYIIMAAVGLAALILLSIILWDIRFVIVTLMYLFIILPMLMALLYINYALSPDIAFNILPHNISAECGMPWENNLSEKSLPEKRNSDKDLRENSININIYEYDEDGKANILRSISFPTSDLGRYIIFSNYVIILFKTRKGFLYLPSEYVKEKKVKEDL